MSSVLDFPSPKGLLMDTYAEHTGRPRFAARTARLGIFTLLWLATIALAKLGPGVLWNRNLPVVSLAAIALNVVVGVLWIIAFIRYVRGLDELQRKLMLDALAVTLGVGWVGGFAYATAAAVGLISSRVELVVLPVLMAAVYLVALAVGKLRYR